MPELRQNMVTKEWVIIASERARRPHDFAAPARAATHLRPAFVPDCPFCPGNEGHTADSLLRLPEDGPWQVRVFSNRYPALSRQGARVQCNDGVHRKCSGVGSHEVLVESPVHNLCPALQTPEEILLTLRAFQERGRDLMGDPRIEQVIYFKNHGPAAGTSLEHPHCQILAMPMVPHNLRTRITEARRSFDDEGRCSMCAMLEMELSEEARLVCENDSFVAFVPFAAFSPFHLWVMPRRHGPTFLDQQPHELADLASIMRLLLGKLYFGLNDPDFNYNIHSAPNRDSSSAYLHWYLSIVPRVTRSAGFELGSGMHINPALPEESAAFLRDQNAGMPATQPDIDEDGDLMPAPNGDGAHKLPGADARQAKAAQIVQTEEWRTS